MAYAAVAVGVAVRLLLSIAQAIHAIVSLLSRRRSRPGADLRLDRRSRRFGIAADHDVGRSAALDGRLRHHLRLPGFPERPRIRRIFRPRKTRRRPRPGGQPRYAWLLRLRTDPDGPDDPRIRPALLGCRRPGDFATDYRAQSGAAG